MVYDKPVSVEWTKHDRYGRIVGKVMVSSPDACPDASPDCPKALDAGLAQITVGLAWHYKQYAKEHTEEDRERYAFAEDEAKAKHAGLWQDMNPVPPWEWRAEKRQRRAE
jgi:endonuclease YncB( thermonuclease family)